MKTSFKELESPYLEGELEFVAPAKELSNDLAHEIGESPFVKLTPAGDPLDELSTGEVFETQFEQEVIGADERTLVVNALAVPNRWVCAIDLLIADPKLGKGVPLIMRDTRGTGILIGPRHVLTAKHVRAPVKVRVDNQDEEVPIAGARQPGAPRRQHEPSARQGVVQGSIRRQAASGSSADKERLIKRCIRNRRDEWASTQWRSRGNVNVDPATSRIEHTADTYNGESGAPICLRNGDVLDLLGVHVDQNKPGIGQPVTSNLGVRVTLHMLREICTWMNADAGYQIATIKDDTLIVQPRIKEAKETLEIDKSAIRKDFEGD